MTDRGVITAGAVSPVDFARHIFDALDVFAPAVLEAWHGLYSSGEARYFYALMEASASTRG